MVHWIGGDFSELAAADTKSVCKLQTGGGGWNPPPPPPTWNFSKVCWNFSTVTTAITRNKYTIYFLYYTDYYVYYTVPAKQPREVPQALYPSASPVLLPLPVCVRIHKGLVCNAWMYVLIVRESQRIIIIIELEDWCDIMIVIELEDWCDSAATASCMYTYTCRLT